MGGGEKDRLGERKSERLLERDRHRGERVVSLLLVLERERKTRGTESEVSFLESRHTHSLTWCG